MKEVKVEQGVITPRPEEGARGAPYSAENTYLT